MDHLSEAATGWVRRLREPALVFGLFLAAAWLPAPTPVWRLALQAVLGIAASVVIVRSTIQDRVGLTGLGVRVDNFVPSSFVFLVVTALPLVAVHRLVGKPGLRMSGVLMYVAWALFQQFVVVAGFWRHFRPTTPEWTARRTDLAAAAVTATLFALAHAPNFGLMGAVFGAELVWLVCFARFRNLFALALAHSVAAIVVKHDLVPGWLVSMKVGSGYWWP